MNTKRWNYLKALKPSVGQFLHVSKWIDSYIDIVIGVKLVKQPNWKYATYNIGRNKAKRLARSMKRIKRHLDNLDART